MNSMNRRTYLTLTSGAVIAGMAGCIGDGEAGESGDSGDDDEPTDDDSDFDTGVIEGGNADDGDADGDNDEDEDEYGWDFEEDMPLSIWIEPADGFYPGLGNSEMEDDPPRSSYDGTRKEYHGRILDWETRVSDSYFYVLIVNPSPPGGPKDEASGVLVAGAVSTSSSQLEEAGYEEIRIDVVEDPILDARDPEHFVSFTYEVDWLVRLGNDEISRLEAQDKLRETAQDEPFRHWDGMPEEDE